MLKYVNDSLQIREAVQPNNSCRIKADAVQKAILYMLLEAHLCANM